MMLDGGKDLLEQIDRHLASPSLAWLFGAGISFDAQIPLMQPLTSRVMALLSGSVHLPLLTQIMSELPDGAHVEHLLSQLVDYAALADRSKTREVKVGSAVVGRRSLSEAHQAVVTHIANTIRWGFQAATPTQPERIGSRDNPIINIDGHRSFVAAAFKTVQAGLQDRRGPVRLFTINYDTLLEDALALGFVPHWDGFEGGAVAFRAYRFGQSEPGSGFRAHVIKLHGSIDWYVGDDGRVWRVRDGDTYPGRSGQVLIYPQATKYLATQRDPFAAQFDLLRRTLVTSSDNVLAICGYSFGDEHINQEIEIAMSRPENKTTLLAFCIEVAALPACLMKWRCESWGARVYIATEKGLYVGRDGPFHEPARGNTRNWWTFSGLTKLLRDGAEGIL